MLIAWREYVLCWELLPCKCQLLSAVCGVHRASGEERGVAGGARVWGEEKGGIASVPVKDAKELGPFPK